MSVRPTCSRCATPIRDNARFCAQCGLSVNQAASVIPVPSTPTNGKLMMGLIAGLIIGVLLFLGVMRGTSSPRMNTTPVPVAELPDHAHGKLGH